MVRQFEHFVFTRFNLLLKDAGDDDPTLDDEWLRYRLELFERWTLPSVRAQTEQDFRYCILCRRDSPRWFKDHVNRNWLDRIEMMWEDPAKCRWCCRWRVKQYLRENARAAWVISSRIDNDDAYACDFIETIQQAFRPQTEWLSVPAGICNRIHSRELIVIDYYNNPFSTLVEKAESAEGCFVARHDEIEQFAPVRKLQTPPMWMNVIHGRNLGTRNSWDEHFAGTTDRGSLHRFCIARAGHDARADGHARDAA